MRKCWTVWHKAYPQIPPGNQSDFIEEQGPVVGWCQVIALFATAAEHAGADLNRRTFVTAMSKITDFPGTNTPVLSYGPDKRYGPTEYQVVRLHINSPVSTQCHLPEEQGPPVHLLGPCPALAAPAHRLTEPARNVPAAIRRC